ncbi:MAG: hypothetical protein GX386_07605 [Clostridiaceae bacterium]|jgi:hypothetical protein|nr:hypothetical protein [Clostridiaceae bacterium]
MIFKSKLNYIFENMGFSNVEVARVGNFDASLISRFRTGKRIPSKESRQIYCLCKGLLKAAQEHGTLDQLCFLCKINDVNDIDLITDQLLRWLETPDLKKERISKSEIPKTKSNRKLKAFSEKLNTLMEAFDISNIKLAQVMHIDASLVSRFRTGMRVPTVSSWFPEQFCQWLVKKAKSYSYADLKEVLSPLIGNPVPKKTTELKKKLLEWMQSEPETDETIITSSFLDQLNSYEPIFEVPANFIESFPIIPPSQPESGIFYGIEGLRKAVIQFLTIAAAQDEPGTLYLYSDQPIDWLTEDSEFANLWASLMSKVLYRRNQIYIIHNIHRSLSEMFEAIQKWIPLYMTGLIKPYYLNNKQNGNFCQTKFILSEKCSINSSFVYGTQDSAGYEFYTEKSRVDYHRRQFNELLKNSHPLVNVFSLRNPDDFRAFTQTPIKKSGREIHLRYTLPISTMPNETFERILSRSNLSPEEKILAEEYRNNNVTDLIHSLKKYSITDLIAIPDENDIKSHKVIIDLPKPIIGKTLFYEEAEFSSHITNIKRFLLDNENYHLYMLPESPFENVFISVLGEAQSIVVKVDNHATLFLFNHPLMNRAFYSYLNSIAENAMPCDYNKNNDFSTSQVAVWRNKYL